MEQLIPLGTGNAMVTKCYNTCFVIKNENEVILTDSGGGNTILARLEAAKIPIENIHHLIITHEHCDHILGIVWIVRKIATLIKNGAYSGQLHMYCHTQLVKTIKTICFLTLQKKFTDLFDQQILFHEISDGSKETLGSYQVTFFDIFSEKALQMGFTLELKNGKKLTCLGDEPYNSQCEKYVIGSHWLLCEAFCLYAQRNQFKPYEKHHSTVREACELGEKLKIPHLVLWHTEDKNYENRKELYTEEGKSYYNGDLHVPYDLEAITL